MVVVDVDGTGERPVNAGQHNGQPAGGSHIQQLMHQRQPAGGGRGHRSGARRLGANAGGQGGMLRLHGDILGIHQAVGHILGEILGNLGGGRDGKGPHHVGINLAHGKGHGLVARQAVAKLSHGQSTSPKEMAPKGQTAAQMPQPLQCSKSSPAFFPSATRMELSGQKGTQSMQCRQASG
ncbi:hypothetical protein SDC9_168152 [bioreactor metagenome]|uniref:Uncharacterized protein n=1 Tax=bioreactor metagenome TaxID=1076179 RepID=A0A645GA57_9ZZZZ